MKLKNIRTLTHEVSGEQVKATKRVLKSLARGEGYSAQDGDIANELLSQVVDVYEGKIGRRA
jgi:hypothetical protein